MTQGKQACRCQRAVPTDHLTGMRKATRNSIANGSSTKRGRQNETSVKRNGLLVAEARLAYATPRCDDRFNAMRVCQQYYKLT